MERVVFLVEATGERISCLLNPDDLVMRRAAGIVPQPGRTGRLGGRGHIDDPVLRRGGGRTEIELALVFDVSLIGSDRSPTDVRQLTAPLWRLTESDGQQAIPPDVVLIWGKSIRVPGVIDAIAERLERFTPAGVPERSWVRCRMIRREPMPPPVPTTGADSAAVDRTPPQVLPGEQQEHEVIGGGGPDDQPYGQRLDELAADFYGDPTRWRWLAAANDVDMPPWPSAGTVLRIPGDPPSPGQDHP